MTTDAPHTPETLARDRVLRELRAQWGRKPIPEIRRVYFIGCVGHVKIGIAQDPEQRRATMQAHNPFPLVLLHHEPGGVADENSLHHRFSHLKVRGEWFHLTDEIRDYIAERAG